MPNVTRMKTPRDHKRIRQDSKEEPILSLTPDHYKRTVKHITALRVSVSTQRTDGTAPRLSPISASASSTARDTLIRARHAATTPRVSYNVQRLYGVIKTRLPAAVALSSLSSRVIPDPTVPLKVLLQPPLTEEAGSHRRRPGHGAVVALQRRRHGACAECVNHRPPPQPTTDPDGRHGWNPKRGAHGGEGRVKTPLRWLHVFN
ncbi:hypothetical protein SRHO_G00232080 [Serrasalmus rhombeus]